MDDQTPPEEVVTVESLAGVTEDTIIETVIDGQTIKEVVKGDRDNSGTVIGWHKEVVA